MNFSDIVLLEVSHTNFNWKGVCCVRSFYLLIFIYFTVCYFYTFMVILDGNDLFFFGNKSIGFWAGNVSTFVAEKWGRERPLWEVDEFELVKEFSFSLDSKSLFLLRNLKFAHFQKHDHILYLKAFWFDFFFSFFSLFIFFSLLFFSFPPFVALRINFVLSPLTFTFPSVIINVRHQSIAIILKHNILNHKTAQSNSSQFSTHTAQQ